MNSDLPKVLHPVADEPMVKWVIDACREVGAQPIVLIVGHGADEVRSAFTGDDADLLFALQEPQLGTGHAVMQARPFFGSAGLRAREEDGRAQRPGPTELGWPGSAVGDVLVLAGDGPLIRAETLNKLIAAHRRSNAAATLATAVIDEPTGYGRIVRDAAGRFERIVEHRDATPDELALREINPSYYIFRAKPLFEALDRIGNDNAKGEYYLTDVFALFREDGERVEVVEAAGAEDVLSINTPEQLEEVGRILRSRLESAAGRRTG